MRLIPLRLLPELRKRLLRCAMTVGAAAVRQFRWQRLGRLIEQNVLAQHLRKVEDMPLEKLAATGLSSSSTIVTVFSVRGPANSCRSSNCSSSRRCTGRSKYCAQRLHASATLVSAFPRTSSNPPVLLNVIRPSIGAVHSTSSSTSGGSWIS